MDSLHSSVRTRYWLETSREFFSSNSAIAHACIFGLAVVAIIICRGSAAALWIMILTIIFSKRLIRSGLASRNPAPFAARREPPPVPRTSRGDSAEVARLLSLVEQMEKRVIQLESAVTAKEFDWERRLSQVAPRD